ncbi:MAG: DUF1499 domain-containing protein [bacterium]|nr:MAG: DUF1499 domain-containing protein [bacterium]
MANEIQAPDDARGNAVAFPDCPDTPNCVSSLARDAARRVQPFPLVGTAPESIGRLATIILSMPRTKVTEKSETFIRAEFRSVLGFVDDVTFMALPGEGIVHVRSASRTGTWDLGVNRRRVERIRKRYLERG